jgi:DNA (cytosine-5)-methyltransferase 1
MATWEFNRGEWTEAYVFLRLLGDGRLYGASADLRKDSLTYIDVINIIRDEPDKYMIFERFIKDNAAFVQSSKNGDILKIITAPELSERAAYLYEQIKTVNSGERKIKIPDVQRYLEELSIDSPKANLSESAKKRFGAKTDIIVTTEDSFDHIKTVGGFSIKSHIGSSPTLFNCSQTSGFIYKIVGCDIQGMHRLNYKEDFLSIISSIKQDYALEYVGCRNEVFEQNIRVVDSRMDEILQEALLINVGYFDSPDSTSITDVCTSLAIRNPVHVRNPQVFYEAKLKAFLFASFAGMTASTDWNGRKKLTGGYIDVDREGELLYYRAISDDIFENYLFKHTYLDRPDRGVNKALAIAESRVYIDERRELTEIERKRIIYRNGESGAKNSKKGDFGYVYQEGDDFYIVINFQIRFR